VRTTVNLATVREGAWEMSLLSEVGRFEVQTWPDRDRVIVTLRGELDIETVPTVREALDELHAAQWDSVVLDLRELTFIDSMGLSLLLEADSTARRTRGSFAIVDGSPAVARLLALVGLAEHFERAHVR
jgi:anti-sigma B factor antagonist